MNDSITVSIIGGTLWGNRGAEAMTVTTVGMIRAKFPNARINILSYYPERDSELCCDSNISILNAKPLHLLFTVFFQTILIALFRMIGINIPASFLSATTASFRESSLLCDVGGITFCDSRIVYLPYNILCILPALLLRTPVVKLSQAMGPCQKFVNRVCAQQILQRCRFLFARGKKTLQYLKDSGLQGSEDCSVLYAADTAFCFQNSFSLTREHSDSVVELSQRIVGKNYIAIMPSGLIASQKESYTHDLKMLCEYICSLGKDVVLIPNATKDTSNKNRNNDIPAILEIVSILNLEKPELSQKIFYVDFDVNTSSIRTLLEGAEFVVTSRFHAMVAALSLEVPPMIIGWSHKYLEVLSEFDISFCCYDMNDYTSELIKSFDSLYKRRDEIRSRIRTHRQAVIASSSRQFKMVSDFLANT